MIAAADPLIGFAKQQANEFDSDPVEYFIRTSRKLGAGLMIGGAGCALVGYYLQQQASASANSATATIGSLGAIFGNLQAPNVTFSGNWGSAPVNFSFQGIYNFFNDAWSDLTNVGGDLASIGGGIATALEDIPTALIDLGNFLFQGIVNFPKLLWDGMVAGIGGAIAIVLNWAFPYMLIGGFALIVASVIATGIRRLARIPGRAWHNATQRWIDRHETTWEARFDRLLGNTRSTVTDTSLTMELSVPEARTGGPLMDKPLEPPLGPASAGGSGLSPDPAELGSTIPVKIPVSIETVSHPVPVNQVPLGEIPTREELENVLGEARTSERDRIKLGLPTLPEQTDLESQITLLEEGLET